MERLRAFVSWISTGVIAVGMALVVVLTNHGATTPASKITVETGTPKTSVTVAKIHHTVTHHASSKPISTVLTSHAATSHAPVSPPTTKPAVHSVTTTSVAPTSTTSTTSLAPTTTIAVPVTSTTTPRRDGGDTGTPGVDN